MSVEAPWEADPVVEDSAPWESDPVVDEAAPWESDPIVEDEPEGVSFTDLAKRVPAGIASASADVLAGLSKIGGDIRDTAGRLIGIDPSTEEPEIVDYWRQISERAASDYGVDEARSGQFASKLVGGATSLVPLIAAAPLGAVGAGLAGAGMMGESGRKDAVSEGATEEQTNKSFYLNAAVGVASEALMGVPALLRSAKAAGLKPKTFQQLARAATIQAAKSFGREGTQEAIEQMAGNTIASTLAGYDPERGTFEGVGEAALIGGLIGAPFGAAIQTAQDLPAVRHALSQVPKLEAAGAPETAAAITEAEVDRAIEEAARELISPADIGTTGGSIATEPSVTGTTTETTTTTPAAPAPTTGQTLPGSAATPPSETTTTSPEATATPLPFVNESDAGTAPEPPIGPTELPVARPLDFENTADIGTAPEQPVGPTDLPVVQSIEAPEFKSRFGQSKAVDETGAPMLVVHGSKADVDFDKFDFTKANGVDVRGAFFTPVQSKSGGMEGVYTRDAKVIKHAYVRLENPATNKEIQAAKAAIEASQPDLTSVQKWGAVTDLLLSQGYDGAIRGDKEVVVFKSPDQIIPADRSGAPRITKTPVAPPAATAATELGLTVDGDADAENLQITDRSEGGVGTLVVPKTATRPEIEAIVAERKARATEFRNDPAVLRKQLEKGLEVQIPDDIIDNDLLNPEIEFTFRDGKAFATGVKQHRTTATEDADPLETLRQEVLSSGIVPPFNEITSRLKIGTPQDGGNHPATGIIQQLKEEIAERYPKLEVGGLTEDHPVVKLPVPDEKNKGKTKWVKAKYPVRNVEGKIVPVFTNDPEVAMLQFDLGKPLIVPRKLAAAGKTHPRIKTEERDGRTYVTGVVHPTYGLIDRPGQLEEAYRNDPERKKKQLARTGGSEFKLETEKPGYQASILELPAARDEGARLLDLMENEIGTRIANDERSGSVSKEFDMDRLRAHFQAKLQLLMRSGDLPSKPNRKYLDKLYFRDRNTFLEGMRRDPMASLDEQIGDEDSPTRGDLVEAPEATRSEEVEKTVDLTKPTLAESSTPTQGETATEEAAPAEEAAPTTEAEEKTDLYRRASLEVLNELDPASPEARELLSMMNSGRRRVDSEIGKRMKERKTARYRELKAQEEAGTLPDQPEDFVSEVLAKLGIVPREMVSEDADEEGAVARAKSSDASRETALANIEALETIGLTQRKADGTLAPLVSKDPVNVLLKTIAGSKLPPWQKTIANLILASGIKTNGITIAYSNRPDAAAAATYTRESDVTRGRITLNLAAGHQGGIAQSILHELVHHLTIWKLSDGYKLNKVEKEARENLEKIYESAVIQLFLRPRGNTDASTRASESGVLYGLTNIHEFLSELLTNGEFQAALSQMQAAPGIPLPGSKVRIRSMLDAVHAWVKQLLAGKTVTTGSLLDQALDQALKFAFVPASGRKVAPELREVAESRDRMRDSTPLSKAGNLMLGMFQGDIRLAPDGSVARLGTTDVGVDGWLSVTRFFKATHLPKNLLPTLRETYPDAFRDEEVNATALVRGLQERPMVEVKTLGGASVDNTQQYEDQEARIIHELDTVWPNWRQVPGRLEDATGPNERAETLRQEYVRLAENVATDPLQNEARPKYGFLAPKSESEMPGYVEGLVRVPHTIATRGNGKTSSKLIPTREGPTAPPLYTGPHFGDEDTNVLAFFRGYEETVNGRKVFHVIEVQSDWAQGVRKAEDELAEHDRLHPGGSLHNEFVKRIPAKHPLLEGYETLALKAAIEHARSVGAEAVMLSDAETAMMTEGHDRSNGIEPSAYNVAIAKRILPDVKNLEPLDTYRVIIETVASGKATQLGLSEEHLDFITNKGFVISHTPPQAGGMRLHYETTLPAALRKLTGAVGRKVEVGTHKAALKTRDVPRAVPEEEELQNLEAAYRAGDLSEGIYREMSEKLKKDIIARDTAVGSPVFKNADGTPKSSITGRLYPINEPRTGKYSFRKQEDTTSLDLDDIDDFLDENPDYAEDGSYFVQDGDLSDTLTTLEQSPNKSIAALAKKLNSLGMSTTIRVVDTIPIPDDPLGRSAEGVYEDLEDAIVIRRDFDRTEAETEELVIHEALHAATAWIVANPKTKEAKAFKKELTRIYELTKKKLNYVPNLDTYIDKLRERRDYELTSIEPDAEENIAKLNEQIAKAERTLEQTPVDPGGKVAYALTNLDEFVAGLAHKEVRDVLNDVYDGNRTLWERIVDAVRDLFGVKPDTVLESALANLLSIDARSREKSGKDVVKKKSLYSIDPRGRTTALAKTFWQSSPQLREKLADVTYIKGSNKEDFEAASNFITQIFVQPDATLEHVVAELENLNSFSGIDKNQATLARFMVSHLADQAVIELGRQMGNRGTIDQKLLAEHYAEMAFQQGRKVQEELSQAGSMQSRVGAFVARMFTPAKTVNEYVVPIAEAQHTALKNNTGAQAIKGAFGAAREAGANGAVDKADKLLQQAVSPQQNFDFFDEVFGQGSLQTSQWITRFTRGTGLPYTEDIMNGIAKAMVKKLSPKGNGAAKPFTTQLIEEVQRIVSSQLMSLIPKEAAQPKDNAAKLADAMVGLLRDTDHASLVEGAFIQARRDLLASDKITEEQKAELRDARLDLGKLQSAQAAVKNYLDLKEVVRHHLSDRNATRDTMIAELLRAQPSLSSQQAEAVGKALASAFDLLSRKEAANQLTQLAKEKSKTKLVKPADVPTYLKLANLGAFNDHSLYDAIARNNPKLKLPVQDQAFVDHIRKEAERIQGLPKDSDVRNAALGRLNAEIAWKYLDNLKGKDKAGYYFDVALSVWRSSVLSGPATQAVNAGASAANVMTQSFFDAMGYAIEAKAKGAKTSEVLPFFTDAIVGWMNAVGVGRKGPAFAKTEFKSAITSGQSRYANEKGADLALLEKFKGFHALSPYKWIGRLMVATDSWNASTANEMKQRMAFRRAILEGKTTGNLADAFNPSTAVIDAINSQVEEEVTNGLIPEKERDMRVVELMERRRAELLPGIIEEGRRAAEDWTFNSEPKGLIGYLLHGVTSDINRKTKVGGYLFSFMRTAANVLNAAIDYSPYGILRAYNFSAGDKLLPNTSKYSRQADGEAFTRGSQEFYTEISKATLGAAAIFALAAAMAKGLEEEEEGKIPWFAIYGNGPRTSMERRQLQQGIGWQANSIKIGDNVLRFSEWPALGYALGGLGTLADAIRFKTAGDVPNEEKVMLWSLGMVSTILDRNLLQGVSALFGAIANPNAQGISKLKQLGGGIVSGYSNPQALKFLRASTDIEDNGMVKVLEQGSTHGWLMSMLPMSAGYDKAAQNVFGEDVEEFPWSPLTKRFGMADTVQRHPILSPLVAKGLMVPLPSKNTEIVVNGKAIPLSRNNDIYRAFVKYRGDALKKRLTPTMITRLTTMDKDRAEDLLKGSINSAVREYAVAKIKQDIRNGTLKPDFTKEKER